MDIQAIIDALKNSGKGLTIEYFKISLPAAVESAADGVPPTVAAPKDYKCEECGKPFKPFTWKGGDYTAETAFSWSLRKNGRAICLACVKKSKEKEIG